MNKKMEMKDKKIAFVVGWVVFGTLLIVAVTKWNQANSYYHGYDYEATEYDSNDDYDSYDDYENEEATREAYELLEQIGESQSIFNDRMDSLNSHVIKNGNAYYYY